MAMQQHRVPGMDFQSLTHGLRMEDPVTQQQLGLFAVPGYQSVTPAPVASQAIINAHEHPGPHGSGGGAVSYQLCRPDLHHLMNLVIQLNHNVNTTGSLARAPTSTTHETCLDCRQVIKREKKDLTGTTQDAAPAPAAQGRGNLQGWQCPHHNI